MPATPPLPLPPPPPRPCGDLPEEARISLGLRPRDQQDDREDRQEDAQQDARVSQGDRLGIILNDPSNDANLSSAAYAFEERVTQGANITDAMAGQNSGGYENRVQQEQGQH